MTTASNWSVPPAALKLERHEVHIWRAYLDTDQTAIQLRKAALAQDELERASRFVFARDRDRFIATASASRTPGRPEPFLSDDGDRWTIRSFEPEVGYAGAVVVQGEDLPCFWEFNHR